MEYTIIYSSRKTLSLEVTSDLEVIVRAPKRCPKRVITAFVNEKYDWILKTQEKIKERNQKAALLPKLSEKEIHALALRAKKEIPPRVEYYAQILNVDYGRISIRNQVSRWGSCSSKGNLNFNCKLMLAPQEVIDYVVVHELCHRIEMNHSPRFWANVEAVLPDYKNRRKWLKEHGSEIMALIQ